MTVSYAYSDLTTLSDVPPDIMYLQCYSNQLTCLPPLHENITQLSCGNNQLISLPVLPPKLTQLWCGNNRLRDLPEFPATLRRIWCGNNKLSHLPNLPAETNDLACEENQITSLPDLPVTLEYLNCSNNLLTTLPPLPPRLKYVDSANNSFIEPFKSWINEYNRTGDIKLLTKRIAVYWKRMNLKNLMVTVGMRETQAQMGRPRDETLDRLQDTLNADCLSVIGDYLTGVKGSIKQKTARIVDEYNLYA